MTRIDPRGEIAGFPALAIRRLLRDSAAREIDVEWIAELLDISQPRARRLAAELVGLGYWQKGERRGWTNTVPGNALAWANATRPIHRATAERIVAGLRERLDDQRRRDDLLYRVERAIIFGSFAKGAERVGDIDVAIRLVQRERYRDDFFQHERRHTGVAIRAGRRFSNFSEELSWPRTEVWRFLRARSPYLSLQDLERYEERGMELPAPTIILYEDERE